MFFKNLFEKEEDWLPRGGQENENDIMYTHFSSMKKHETGKKWLAGAWQTFYVPKLLMMSFSDSSARYLSCAIKSAMYLYNVHVRVEKVIRSVPMHREKGICTVWGV